MWNVAKTTPQTPNLYFLFRVRLNFFLILIAIGTGLVH